jgi:hypothetical protein
LTTEEYRYLVRQINFTNQRIEELYKLINAICSDLNVNRGSTLYRQLETMNASLRTVSDDINSGQVRNLRYKMDDLQKTLEFLQEKFK